MGKPTFRTILVIGDNHRDIVKKYSADTEGNEENAHYRYERCQQHRLEVTGEEGDFSDPFPLKDGWKSYSTHYNMIDWERLHNNPEKIEQYRRAWEMVVDGDEPQNENEKLYKERMINHTDYFRNFDNIDKFLKHSTSFWHWGIATEDSYEDASDKDAYEWTTNFFDRFIKPLEKENPLITIYEVKTLG